MEEIRMMDGKRLLHSAPESQTGLDLSVQGGFPLEMTRSTTFGLHWRGYSGLRPHGQPCQQGKVNPRQKWEPGNRRAEEETRLPGSTNGSQRVDGPLGHGSKTSWPSPPAQPRPLWGSAGGFQPRWDPRNRRRLCSKADQHLGAGTFLGLWAEFTQTHRKGYWVSL